jgi:tetratricopeptide (TPR) repeat protein
MINCNSDEIQSILHQGETYLTTSHQELAADNNKGSLETAKAAERCFTEVIDDKSCPSCWAYAHRGEALRFQGRYDDAVKDFQAAVEQPDGTGKDYAWAYAHWGETLRDKQIAEKAPEAPEAREKFSKAISLDPNYAWAYAHRGATYSILPNSPDLDAALEDFSKAIELYNKYLDQPGYCTGNGYAWARAWRSVVNFMKLLKSCGLTLDDEKCYEGIMAYYDLLVAITVDSNIIALEWRCEIEEIMAKHNVVVK